MGTHLDVKLMKEGAVLYRVAFNLKALGHSKQHHHHMFSNQTRSKNKSNYSQKSKIGRPTKTDEDRKFCERAKLHLRRFDLMVLTTILTRQLYGPGEECEAKWQLQEQTLRELGNIAKESQEQFLEMRMPANQNFIPYCSQRDILYYFLKYKNIRHHILLKQALFLYLLNCRANRTLTSAFSLFLSRKLAAACAMLMRGPEQLELLSEMAGDRVVGEGLQEELLRGVLQLIVQVLSLAQIRLLL